MARRKKGGDAPGPPPVAGWMATYSDMITNMLCFFVLMLSTANMDQAKFDALASALNSLLSGAGHVLPNTSGLLPDQGSGQGNGDNNNSGNGDQDNQAVLPPIDIETLDPEADQEQLRQLMQELQQYFGEDGVLEQVEIKLEERGIVVRLADSILFESASATLLSDAQQTLMGILPTLKSISNSILVEGHTCDLPINTYEFPDNWALSSSRALSVLRFLQANGIAPERMRAVGHGEYHFIVPNNSEENRRKNRRVDIVILSSRSEQTTE